jgi:hypothetical protein
MSMALIIMGNNILMIASHTTQMLGGGTQLCGATICW